MALCRGQRVEWRALSDRPSGLPTCQHRLDGRLEKGRGSMTHHWLLESLNIIHWQILNMIDYFEGWWAEVANRNGPGLCVHRPSRFWKQLSWTLLCPGDQLPAIIDQPSCMQHQYRLYYYYYYYCWQFQREARSRRINLQITWRRRLVDQTAKWSLWHETVTSIVGLVHKQCSSGNRCNKNTG